jgi:hypothetical protein
MSGPKKYLRTEGAERIDQPDFEHAVEESQLAGLTQLGESFVVGSDAGQKHYVLSGFQVTDGGGGGNITVGAGAAFLSWQDQGNVEHGVLINATSAKTVTMATALTGTPNAYIKFNLQDSEFENRNFWNSLAATPVEIPRQIATRRVDSFEITFDTNSPGTEWMEVGTITIASLTGVAGSTTGITDKRAFYFEGTLAASYSPTNDWGGGTDRNVDRATYGLKGLRQFVRATQSQLFNAISQSGGGWYDDPTTLPTTAETGATQGLSLSYTKSEALSRLGDAAVRLGKRMSGNLIVSASNTYNIGEQATPWADIHSGGISLGLERLTAALADDPRIVIKAAAGNLSTKILTSIIDSITPDGTTVDIIRMPPVSSDLQLPGGLYGTLAIAVNCYYDNAVGATANVWKRYDNAKHSYLLELGTAAGDGGGMRLWFHHEASNNIWNNTGAGAVTDWTLYFGAGMRGQTVGTTTGVAKNSVVTGQVELPTGGLTAAGDLTSTATVTGSSVVSGTCTLARHVGYIEIATGGGSVTRSQINGTFSAALSGTNAVRVTLTDAFSGVNTYAIIATATGYFPSVAKATSGVMAVPVSDSIFDVFFMNEGTATNTRLDLADIAANAAIRIYIMTFGS